MLVWVMFAHKRKFEPTKAKLPHLILTKLGVVGSNFALFGLKFGFPKLVI